jgi:hypothetical protein
MADSGDAGNLSHRFALGGNYPLGKHWCHREFADLGAPGGSLAAKSAATTSIGTNRHPPVRPKQGTSHRRTEHFSGAVGL